MSKLSLAEKSSIVSCEHMKQLAEKERDFNFYRFHKNITTCNQTLNALQENSSKELKLQQGWRIDKNNCVYKSPEYNPGEWENQFQRILPDSFGIGFNIKSKRN